jgi:uncharacterized repeat protein (TIGR01451 family)
LDADDHPHISYYDETNDGLKYAHWTGAAWQFEIIDSEGGTDTSLALDGSGRPHISYYDRAHQALKYATLSVPPDLASSVKAAYPLQLNAGGIVTYTLRVANGGNLYQSAPFTLTDPIPLHTSYVPGSAQASGGTIRVAEGITWVGSVAGMQSLVATYALRVSPAWTQPTAIVNRATLVGDPTGPLTLSAVVLVNPLEAFLPLVAKDG